MSRVALISADTCVQERLVAGLGAERYGELVTTLPGVADPQDSSAVQSIGAGSPEVVIFGPGMETVEALCLAERIEREHPEITMVLVAEPTSELWELALQAGIRYLVSPDDPPASVTGAVERALEIAERRRSNLIIDVRDEIAATTPPSAPELPGQPRRVITVLSPKGGSGKTTVATNLAVGLAQLAPGAVALVDLDLQFGDVADALLLRPSHTLADLSPGAVDPAAVKLLLTTHESSLFALCGPDDPAAGEEVSVEAVTAAIHSLSSVLPYVIIDTGAGIEAAALAAVEVSTDLVLVGAMDVPSIRSLRKLLDALDVLGMTSATRHVVLNRADSKVGIEVSDVENLLGLPVAVSVPSSRLVPLSMNHGQPLLLADPGSPVARPLHELVGRFADVPVPLAARGGRRRFRRSAR